MSGLHPGTIVGITAGAVTPAIVILVIFLCRWWKRRHGADPTDACMCGPDGTSVVAVSADRKGETPSVPQHTKT